MVQTRFAAEAGDFRPLVPADLGPGGGVGAGQLIGSAVFGPGGGMLNGTLVATVAANALTVAIKTRAGADPSSADPVWVVFPSSQGLLTALALTSAQAITIPQGATLGATSANTAFKVWIGVLNVGAPALCVYQTIAFNLFDTIIAINDLTYIDTTAISAGATTAGQMYATGNNTAVAWQQIGFMEFASGFSPVGNWVNPSTIRVAGSAVMTPNRPLRSIFKTDQIAVNISNTTNTPTLCGPTISYAPLYASNFHKITAVSNLYTGATVNGNVVTYGVMRNGVTNLSTMGMIYENFASAGATISNCIYRIWDFPNTTASTTWQAFAQQSANGGNAQVGNVSVGLTNMLEIEEVMT